MGILVRSGIYPTFRVLGGRSLRGGNVPVRGALVLLGTCCQLLAFGGHRVINTAFLAFALSS